MGKIDLFSTLSENCNFLTHDAAEQGYVSN